MSAAGILFIAFGAMFLAIWLAQVAAVLRVKRGTAHGAPLVLGTSLVALGVLLR